MFSDPQNYQNLDSMYPDEKLWILYIFLKVGLVHLRNHTQVDVNNQFSVISWLGPMTQFRYEYLLKTSF